MLVDPRQAADLLRVSERTLRDLTVPHGDLPAVRIGRLVRYRTTSLTDWAQRHEAAA
ncbi:helix-turn-helix domain-containing protein [Alienimonas californiensis]|uniref:helix-turn-helix domain-containing protein n=1 Tax=Alienimonas californiensis TaxID=2527989 RepID=UPI0013FCFB4F|nr:helix-turn-helix domain-containing protein [Alienimonas californiensis]